MYCDIYSLGQGEVCHTDERAVFSVRNLQVVYGYVFDRIPQAVLALACGPLGKWQASDGTMPLLEIVHHRQSPLAYLQLPPECRTKDFQKSGSQRRLVPITNPVERAMFASGTLPYKVEPAPLRPGMPRRWAVPDLKGEAQRKMEELRRPAAVTSPLEPQPTPASSPFPAKPQVGPKDPHARPDITDFLPRADEVKLDPGALDFGGPRPGDAVSGGLLDERDVEPPREDGYLVAPPTHCTASTSRGEPCRRPVKKGTAFCGGHQSHASR